MNRFREKARAGWGGDPPSWVLRLAAEADAQSLAAAGRAIGYGKSTVSLVLSGSYGAGVDKVRAAVVARLVTEITCPVLGPIPAERCRTEQDAPYRAAAPLPRLLRAACRSCPHRGDGP